MPTPPSTAEPTWLGHPRGLVVLFVAEMWERMSYYGMRALLVLYMLQHLFVRPDGGAGVWGYATLRRALETAFGALSTQALSSQVYGLYTGFVYLSPLFGGLLADRLIGRRRAVVLGGVLMAIGHFLMASEHLFFVALMVLILGNGCFKPNVSTQVGGLYAPGDPRRDRAFSIFYVGINLGAFIAPLICGTLGQTLGWHWGFGAAGVGMLLGLLFYVFNQHRLPQEPPPTASRTAPGLGVLAYLAGMPLVVLALLAMLTLPRPLALALALAGLGAGLAWIVRLPADERPRVVALALACLVTAAFWAVYEQQGNTMQIWADQRTAWPSVFGFTLPSTWYQAFNPFMIALFVPLLNAVWARQARRGREPGSLTKMALGCVLLGLGFAVMIAAASGLAPGDKRSILWLLASTAIFTTGELYLSPVGLSFVTKVAPLRIVSMMMGLWFLANFIGGYMSGYLGSFYGTLAHTRFFALLAAIGVAAGVVLYAMGPLLRRRVAAHSA